jgi:transposase
MPQRAEVVLSDEERETLERWARRPKSSQALAFRCRIVLAAAEGRSSTEIAAELGCTGSTVGRWRGRFARRGIDGLHDEPRPGKPRTISDQDVERVIAKTLEEQPAGATHWSTRSMPAATGMSQSAVSRIWRAFALSGARPLGAGAAADARRAGPAERATTTFATARPTSTPPSTSPPAR